VEPAAVVRAHWGRLVTAVEPVSSGSVNQLHRIRSQDETTYLRRYRTTDRDVVTREHALMCHVALASVPVTLPLAATSGGTVVDVDGSLYALYPEAEGEQLDRSALALAHARAAGTMLARLHVATEPLPDVGYRRYVMKWSPADWDARLAGLAETIAARAEPHPDDQAVLARLADQRAWLASPRCLHEFVSAFPPQVIHGDYQDSNLFFSAPRAGEAHVSAVIDWEQAAFMPRAFEIARCASYAFALAPEPTRAFVAAYREVSPLGDDELEDGAALWGCMSDHYVWAVEEVYLHRNERARRFIPLPFKPFRWEI
jgi:homoserine kinase type II